MAITEVLVKLAAAFSHKIGEDLIDVWFQLFKDYNPKAVLAGGQKLLENWDESWFPKPKHLAVHVGEAQAKIRRNQEAALRLPEPDLSPEEKVRRDCARRLCIETMKKGSLHLTPKQVEQLAGIFPQMFSRCSVVKNLGVWYDNTVDDGSWEISTSQWGLALKVYVTLHGGDYDETGRLTPEARERLQAETAARYRKRPTGDLTPAGDVVLNAIKYDSVHPEVRAVFEGGEQ